MKNQGAILFKTEHLKNETETEKITTRLFPRFLIFKLQQEVIRFNDICVSWSSPKTDFETNFSNLENRIL